ncbi:MAG: hypothetical protein F4Y00_08800 [Bacteroidetes bacterium SB0662_bin_6]|nr:hypothetical protein [Bacteroidetes bacterium SB0662_bin_6]
MKYLLQDQKIFARAYLQYIAEKSGNQPVLKALDYVRNNSPNFATQWDDADFKPIFAEFEKLFKKLGWRR